MNPNTEKQLTETLSQLDKDQLIELLINLIDSNMKSANTVLNTEKELISKMLPENITRMFISDYYPSEKIIHMIEKSNGPETPDYSLIPETYDKCPKFHLVSKTDAEYLMHPEYRYYCLEGCQKRYLPSPITQCARCLTKQRVQLEEEFERQKGEMKND